MQSSRWLRGPPPLSLDSQVPGSTARLTQGALRCGFNRMVMAQRLKWLAAWAASALACAAGVILAREPLLWPSTQHSLIAIATLAAMAFVLTTLRAHVRPGTSYFGVVSIAVIIACLVAADALPISIEPQAQGFGLIAGAVALILFARPSRQPGQNILATGPTPPIIWSGRLDAVPRITVLLGYVTIDATRADWSDVNELHVTLVASRLELTLPKYLDNVDVTCEGFRLTAEGPRRTNENPLTISVMGALGAVVVEQDPHHAEAKPLADDPNSPGDEPNPD